MEGVTKQRVAVFLATIWFASIVRGSVVPSGETTAFRNLRPSGPSPDQYTLLLRNQRQDDYGQDWMNDQPSRMKVLKQRDNTDRGQSEESFNYDSLPNYELDKQRGTHEEKGSADSKDVEEIKEELDSSEAMKLASMKVAFDESIDSEEFENVSEKDRTKEDIKFDGEMQGDEFLADDTFEDEGPGSVEVYKLDLYKDSSILNPRSGKKNGFKNKSKIPKKVGSVDQIAWKRKEIDETKNNKKSSNLKFDQEFTYFDSSKSLKDRIFGVGGVPELQVGCEGVEASQRQKRSDSKERESKDSNPVSQPAPPAPLYIDLDYDSDEYFDLIEGTGELQFPKFEETTGLPLGGIGRGDMDPKVKTPADLEAKRIITMRTDKLPTRGDLGTSVDPNFAETVKVAKRSNSERHQRRHLQPEVSHRRQLALSLENDARIKRSLENWGYGENESAIIHKSKRHHRNNRRKKLGKRRRRYDKEKNETIGRRKNEDRITREYHKKGGEYLRQEQQSEDLRRREDNERKLQDYIRRNTPLPRRRNEQKTVDASYPPTRYNQKNYENPEEKEGRIELQRKPADGQVTRRNYEKELEKQEKAKKRRLSERPYELRQYQRKSRQEIQRLLALPVSARIVINEKKNTSKVNPVITSRFSEDISFTGLNPSSNGLNAVNFPAPSTPKPVIIEGPSSCVWAIINCCLNENRLMTCFEARGCPGGLWDPDPCSKERMLAAIKLIEKYYEN